MKDYDLIAPFYNVEHAHFDEQLSMFPWIEEPALFIQTVKKWLEQEVR
jgi:hypothetical protein